MKVLKSLLFMLLVFISSSSFCRMSSPQPFEERSYKAILCGTITGGSSKDTIILYFNQSFIYNSIGSKTYTTVCNADGHFYFNLNIDHIAMITLLHHGGTALIANEYMEVGDSVHCLVNNCGKIEKVRFSGAGAEKFNCIDALNDTRRLQDKKSYSENIDMSLSKRDPVNELKLVFDRSTMPIKTDESNTFKILPSNRMDSRKGICVD